MVHLANDHIMDLQGRSDAELDVKAEFFRYKQLLVEHLHNPGIRQIAAARLDVAAFLRSVYSISFRSA